MSNLLLTVAVAAIGYLLGCFSTGILISRQAGVNIREAGSKNTGASNVLRVLGLGRGAITFTGDFIKAALACWIGSLLLPGTTYGITNFGIMVGGFAGCAWTQLARVFLLSGRQRDRIIFRCRSVCQSAFWRDCDRLVRDRYFLEKIHQFGKSGTALHLFCIDSDLPFRPMVCLRVCGGAAS